jgi:cell division septum initiation protein DivIVA
VTDTGMKGRVKGLLGGGVDEPYEQNGGPPSIPSAQHQALQVLNLAQRTAEEHIVNARRQADKICGDARAQADQIVREAQQHAHGLRQEADKALSVAHAAAAQIAREAQAHAENVQRNTEQILSGAQARADELAKHAQADAEELKHRAQQRYEDVVGSLAARREALQQQIEALEQFDREYRARLTAFMQNQLRALWVDEPRVTAEDLEERETVPAHAAGPEHSDESDDE